MKKENKQILRTNFLLGVNKSSLVIIKRIGLFACFSIYGLDISFKSFLKDRSYFYVRFHKIFLQPFAVKQNIDAILVDGG